MCCNLETSALKPAQQLKTGLSLPLDTAKTAHPASEPLIPPPRTSKQSLNSQVQNVWTGLFFLTAIKTDKRTSRGWQQYSCT